MSKWGRFYKIVPCDTKVIFAHKGDRTLTHTVKVKKIAGKIHLMSLHQVKCPMFYESRESEFVLSSYEQVCELRKVEIDPKFKYDDTFPKVTASMWVQSL